jgi:hypothetical protein
LAKPTHILLAGKVENLIFDEFLGEALPVNQLPDCAKPKRLRHYSAWLCHVGCIAKQSHDNFARKSCCKNMYLPKTALLILIF